jgi:hypothetical protein
MSKIDWANKDSAEEAIIDATVCELLSNKQKLWTFIAAAKAISPLIGMSTAEILILYLGNDALRIIQISECTKRLHLEILVTENFLSDENFDKLDQKILKTIIELMEFIFIKSLNTDIEAQITETGIVHLDSSIKGFIVGGLNE